MDRLQLYYLVEIPHSVGLRKVDPPAQQGRGRHGYTPHPGGHHHRHHHRPLHALGQTVLGNQGYIRISSVVLIKYLNGSPEWRCIGRQRCREARRWNSFLKMQHFQSEMALVSIASDICYLELSTGLREVSQCGAEKRPLNSSQIYRHKTLIQSL